MHVIRTHQLALPGLHIMEGSGGHIWGAQGKDSPSGVGPCLVNGPPEGMHPSLGWDGERDLGLQGGLTWGRANSCWCCFQVSRGKELVPARPGWNSLTCELGLEMQRCQGTPGTSLGLWLSCQCCRLGKRLGAERSGRDSHTPTESWTAGDKGAVPAGVRGPLP